MFFPGQNSSTLSLSPLFVILTHTFSSFRTTLSRWSSCHYQTISFAPIDQIWLSPFVCKPVLGSIHNPHSNSLVSFFEHPISNLIIWLVELGRMWGLLNYFNTEFPIDPSLFGSKRLHTSNIIFSKNKICNSFEFTSWNWWHLTKHLCRLYRIYWIRQPFL